MRYIESDAFALMLHQRKNEVSVKKQLCPNYKFMGRLGAISTNYIYLQMFTYTTSKNTQNNIFVKLEGNQSWGEPWGRNLKAYGIIS